MKYRCPNCEYVGEPKKKKSSSSVITTVLLVVASVLITKWLLILTIPAIIWLIVEKRETSCAKCNWAHIVPVD